MTNREKYIDEILATWLYNGYMEDELKSQYGIKPDENDCIDHQQVIQWLQSEYKEPKEIEYIEVTNDIPRLTEIEVYNGQSKKWETRSFLLRDDFWVTPYMVLTDDCDYAVELYEKARVRKDWRKYEINRC